MSRNSRPKGFVHTRRSRSERIAPPLGHLEAVRQSLGNAVPALTRVVSASCSTLRSASVIDRIRWFVRRYTSQSGYRMTSYAWAMSQP